MKRSLAMAAAVVTGAGLLSLASGGAAEAATNDTAKAKAAPLACTPIPPLSLPLPPLPPLPTGVPSLIGINCHIPPAGPGEVVMPCTILLPVSLPGLGLVCIL